MLLHETRLLEDLEVKAAYLEGKREEEVSNLNRRAFDLFVPVLILKHLEELDLFIDCLLELCSCFKLNCISYLKKTMCKY